jgi:carbon-monoxide dehydrogenase medium subunit
LHDFKYFAPTSPEEAVGLLREHADQAHVLAGGTDLLIRMKRGEWVPPVVVSLKKVPGLRGIERRNGALWIGPLTTMAEIVRSDTVAGIAPVLPAAAATVGSVQVRNLATVGGNICNAAPSADTAPPLLVLDAEVDILGPEGPRSIPVADLFTGPNQTSLGPGEILTGIRIPVREGWRAGYRKVEHREAMDLSVAGVAAAVLPASGGGDPPVWDQVRVALGAVAPTPFRAKEVEEMLRGVPVTEDRIARAAEAADEASSPIDDVRGPAWYRRHLLRVLTTRLLGELSEGGAS